MNNEYNRYYIRIRTILGIAPMTIHKELATALGPDVPAYRTVAKWAECFRQGREDVNDDLRQVVRFPNSKMKILNWYDRLLPMIHIQLMMIL